MSKRKRQRGSAARAAPGPDQLRLEADGRRGAPADVGSTAAPADAGSTAAPVDAGSTAAPVDAGSTAAPVDPGSTAAPAAMAGPPHAEGHPAGEGRAVAASDRPADPGPADPAAADPGRGDIDPVAVDGGLSRDAADALAAPSPAGPAAPTQALALDGGPPPDPLGELLTPLSSDLPLVSAETVGPASGDFPTIASNAADAADAAEVPTPVRTRLRRFDTPIPRASTTPPIRPRPPPQVRQPPTPIELPPGTEITGDLLRQLREQRGITLKEIEEVTRVRATSLAAVEAERYVDLPDVKIYIRGFVQALARTIGVDAELAANSYLARWERTRDRTPGARRHFIK